MIDKKEAIKLREQGVTLQKIADRYGVTRQAIYWVVRHILPPENGWPSRRKSSDHLPIFDRAMWGRNYHRNHLKINGKYVYVQKRPRPDICEICGKTARKLDYHHWDDKHLEWGVWVCVRCHAKCAFVENGGYEQYITLKKQIQPPTK